MPPSSYSDWLLALPWIEAATILFGFTWGAMLGSFLNVVVHRLPLGASIVTTPSRCPCCGNSIRPWHNVPVFGWLMLGGRCRDCQAPIAATYPLVEAGCGGITMLLATTELVFGGRWLASSTGHHSAGIDRLLWGDWSLLAVCLLHCGVAITIVAWSLLDQVPWRLRRRHLAIPLVVSLLAVVFMPTAWPVAIWRGLVITPPFSDGLARAMSGIAAGAVLGMAGRGQGVRWGLPLLGSVLGWPGVTVVAIVTALVVPVGRRLTRSRALPGLVVAAAGTLMMAFGGSLLTRLVGS
jgi:prepilin signal peptidase PulO-like enzyme (type II secretory pathway)